MPVRGIVMPKTAIHLHVHFEDVAFKIVEYIRRIRINYTLYVTFTGIMSPSLHNEIFRLSCQKRIIPVANLGRDVLPFLDLICLPEMDEFDVICKLHTKRGTSGLGDVWLDVFLDSLIGNGSQFSTIVDLFALPIPPAIVGPAVLYKPSDAFGFTLDSTVRELAQKIYNASHSGPYGFFAGTMFSARMADLRELISKRDYIRRGLNGIEFRDEPIGNDGGMPHILERLFGLAPAIKKRSIALIGENNRISFHQAPGPVNSARMTVMLAKLAGYDEMPTAPMQTYLSLFGTHPIIGEWEKIAFGALDSDGQINWKGLPDENYIPILWKYPDMLFEP